MPEAPPAQARVVVIGGGVAGCSALYHLALKGWSDLLLVERDELTAGSTWHAAGNCPNFSTSWSLMRLQHYSTRLYATLAGTVGYPIGHHVTGSIRLAHTRARMDEYRHVAGMARHQGIDFAVLTPADLEALYPFLDLHDLEGGLWDPQDGDIDPAQLTQAFAKGARDLGARIARGCRVTGLGRRADGAWQVATVRGTVTAEVVVNAAGYRAAEVAAMAGRDLPCVTLEHQYLVTEAIPELAARPEKLPLLRDPDDSYYLRQEGHGLLLGPYEKEQAAARWLDGVPEDFAFQLFPDALDRLEPYIAAACRRVPLLGSAGVQRTINGPIPYTPDGNPLIGPAPGLANMFECCVFSFGIVQAGGAGKALADWVVEGEPEWDLWAADPRRFTDFATRRHVVAKAVELYEHEYAIAFPNEERPAGRPARTSPVHARLQAKGAPFGARAGWERALWFPRPGEDPAAPPSFRRAAWFDAVGAECRAVAERVGIMDLPGLSRFEVTGPGAAAWLDRMICGRLPRVGFTRPAYCCSPRGGVLIEMTVTRLDDDRFWLLSAAAGEWHDRDWLMRHLPRDGSVRLENLTGRYGALVVAGPRARDLLGRVCTADLSSGVFPWQAARPVEVGFARAVALRVSPVGELGWELHLPVESLLPTYDLLWEAGRDLGLADFGLYAMDSLRLEKGRRTWKQDLVGDCSPLAAALDRFVALDKPDFIGRAALLAEAERGVKQRLVPLLVEADTADAPPCASVWRNGTRVGLVTSGGYGHRLRRSLALAYLRADLAVEGTAVEVEILGERRPATVAREPMYDPANGRLRM